MEQLPRYFSFAITHRCQSHCVTCNGWQTPKENKFNELSTNDWKFVFNSLHEWLGNFDFIFSGGEPFLREDIFELADYAKSLGLIPKVITNGLALANKCEKLIDSGFQDITISLNAVKNPEIHNVSRGRKNAFKITSDVIQNLTYLNRTKNAGKTILIASVIMPSNLTEMVPLAEFAHQNGIGINFQMLDGGDAFFSASCIQAENLKMFDEMKNQTVEAIDKLLSLKAQGYLIYNTEKQLAAFKDLILISEPQKKEISEEVPPMLDENLETLYSEDFKNKIIEDKICDNNISKVTEIPFTEQYPDKKANETAASCKIGHYNFLIDPYGDVRLCFNFEPVGSLKTSLPQNIWNSEEAEMCRHKIACCDKSCKLLNCNYHEGEE